VLGINATGKIFFALALNFCINYCAVACSSSFTPSFSGALEKVCLFVTWTSCSVFPTARLF
jgi:hypothetical protein